MGLAEDTATATPLNSAGDVPRAFSRRENMKILRITQVLVVEAIEPLLPSWKEALGFGILVEVPEGERLGFVLLARDGQHVMLQTKASLAKDVPAVHAQNPQNVTYIDVDSLDEAQAAMKGMEILVDRRTTFYGAHEAYYRIASGHIVGFAQHDRQHDGQHDG
jgi:hypothetical protein